MTETHASAEIDGTTIEVRRGDLTETEVDAIVNAANTRLQHGGGVAGALARAGGPSIQDESDAWVEEHGPLVPGTAAVTTAGDLPAAHLIHVAGPVYEDGQDNEGLLRQAVRAALDAAAGAGADSVALPAISAGIYGYPQADATAVIAAAACDWARANTGRLARILLVGLDRDGAEHFAEGLEAAA